MITQATSQKHNAVMTLVVTMLFAVIAIAFAAFFMVHDVVPFVQHFTEQLVHPRNT